MTTITSVTEYLESIKGLEIKNNVFFRGHADHSYNLNPGIYREIKDKKNKTLIDYEDQIYREVISKSPQEFLGKTTLESLALLQHYEAPTRVLDLTENALVALFFAVNKGDNEGEVIVFDIPDNFVCHYNSDKVTILANIAKCEKEFNFKSELLPTYRQKIRDLKSYKIEYELLEHITGTVDQIVFKFFFNDSEIKDWVADNEFETENLEELYTSVKERFEENHGKLYHTSLKYFRNTFIDKIQDIFYSAESYSISTINNKYFGKLLHNIREDKSYFDSIIDPVHVSQVFAVKPKLDNPRIVRQQGAFLIFGINEIQFTGFGDYKPMAELNNEWILKGTGEERILIAKDSKHLIMDELEQLGINQSTLFPEVDKVADFVRRKYQNKL